MSGSFSSGNYGSAGYHGREEAPRSAGGLGSSTNGGKSNASGSNSTTVKQKLDALTSGPRKLMSGEETAAQQVERQDPGFGLDTAHEVISGKQASAAGPSLPKGVTPLSQPKPLGAVPYVGEPSLGQVLGTLLGTIAGFAVPGAGVINSLPDIVEGDTAAVPTGGFIGRGIDVASGSVPGKQTGWYQTPERAPIGGEKIPIASSGRIVRDDDQASPLADSLRQVLSSAGSWPPVKVKAI
jgi:hypothetical protein